MEDLEKRVKDLEQWRERVGTYINRLIPLGPNPAREEELQKKRAATLEKLMDGIKVSSEAAAPVDRSARVLADGSPVTPDHRELQPNGQQKGYVVLSDAERAKGWVRPFRDSYKHLKCGSVTTMGRKLAETYARDPGFYSGTFCVGCGAHYPLKEFVWTGGGEQVGS